MRFSSVLIRIHLALEREDRICKCNTDIQTVKHVVLVCPLLRNIREKYHVTDIPTGVMNECFLMEMEQILDIK